MSMQPRPIDKPVHLKIGDEARGALVGVVVGTVLGPFVRELIGRHSERIARQLRRQASSAGAARSNPPRRRR